MNWRKALALTCALLVASPAWAVTRVPTTVYMDTGGSTSNSGTTNAASPLYNGVAGGTGASAVACAATCTATAGTALGAVTAGGANATWAVGGTAISFTAANCTGVVNGMGIWDTTLGSAGLIGVVASSAFSTTCNLTLMAGGALHANSGSTDALYLSSAVTLSSAATMNAIPGCTDETGGSYLCDGSQFIYLNGATNTNVKKFIIAGLTSCAGSGSCIIALGASATTADGSPNPTGVSASTWAIGGRSTIPDTSMEGALNAGATVQINAGTYSCGGAACWTLRTASAGDTVMGRTTITVTSGASVTLQNTGNFSIIANSGGNYWNIQRGAGTLFKLNTTTNTDSAVVLAGGASVGTIWDGLTLLATNNAGSGVHCFATTSGYNRFSNNTISGCNGDAINDSTAASNSYIGNQILSGASTAAISGNGMTFSATQPVKTVEGNLIIGDGTHGLMGITFSGASSANTNRSSVRGNTIANWTTNGLNVSNVFTAVDYYNNIFYNNQSTSGANVTYPNPAGVNLDTSTYAGSHGCNDFYAASGTNLTNVVANSSEITTDPKFVTPVTNVGLQSSSPAVHAGCYQTPGGYSTPNNLIDMGALQTNTSNTSTNVSGSGFIGNGGL